MKRLLIPVLFFAAAAVAEELPPPVQALVDQGIEVEARFDAPGGLTGYVGRYQGQPVAMYLTPDGEHLLVGNLIDAGGDNLTPQHLREHLPEPEFGPAWPLLEQSYWVREGGARAERVVYVFTDPNCPYCNAFWKASQAYLGPDVQVRHIPVAILKADSLGKAARILAADDPGRALARHETYGSKPLEDIPPQIRRQVESNTELMSRLGSTATPTIFYRDSQGKVRRALGVPPEEVLTEEIFQKPPRN